MSDNGNQRRREGLAGQQTGDQQTKGSQPGDYRVTAWLLNELEDSERSDFEELLRKNPEREEDLDSFRQVIGSLSRALENEPLPPFKEEKSSVTAGLGTAGRTATDFELNTSVPKAAIRGSDETALKFHSTRRFWQRTSFRVALALLLVFGGVFLYFGLVLKPGEQNSPRMLGRAITVEPKIAMDSAALPDMADAEVAPAEVVAADMAAEKEMVLSDADMKPSESVSKSKIRLFSAESSLGEPSLESQVNESQTNETQMLAGSILEETRDESGMYYSPSQKPRALEAMGGAGAAFSMPATANALPDSARPDSRVRTGMKVEAKAGALTGTRAATDTVASRPDETSNETSNDTPDEVLTESPTKKPVEMPMEKWIEQKAFVLACRTCYHEESDTVTVHIRFDAREAVDGLSLAVRRNETQYCDVTEDSQTGKPEKEEGQKNERTKEDREDGALFPVPVPEVKPARSVVPQRLKSGEYFEWERTYRRDSKESDMVDPVVAFIEISGQAAGNPVAFRYTFRAIMDGAAVR